MTNAPMTDGLITRRAALMGALAAATPCAAVAAEAQIRRMGYPRGVPRPAADAVYTAPRIGDAIAFEHAGQRRMAHVYGPSAGAPRMTVLLLHGAQRDGRSMLDMWRAVADRHAVALIAPDALNDSWRPADDPPQLLIDALNAAGRRVSIDPARLFMFGHSSGGLLAQYYGNVVRRPWKAVATHGAALAPGDIRKSPFHTPMRLYLGRNDHLFPPEKGRAAAQAFAAAGHPTDLIEIAQHDHWYYAIGPALSEMTFDWFSGLG